jgi:hypothetical protein
LVLPLDILVLAQFDLYPRLAELGGVAHTGHYIGLKLGGLAMRLPIFILHGLPHQLVFFGFEDGPIAQLEAQEESSDSGNVKPDERSGVEPAQEFLAEGHLINL